MFTMSTKQASNPVIVIIVTSSDTPVPAPVSNPSPQLVNLDSATCSPQCLPYLIDAQNYAMTNHTLQPNPPQPPDLGSTFWNQASGGAPDFSTSNLPYSHAPFNPGSWTDPQQTWAINFPPSASLEAATDAGVGSVDGNIASRGRRKAVS